jgi:putative intracellular protease/amidase
MPEIKTVKRRYRFMVVPGLRWEDYTRDCFLLMDILMNRSKKEEIIGEIRLFP